MADTKTSWAVKAHLFMKEVEGESAVLPTNMMADSTLDMGCLDEDGFGVDVQDGQELELRDINGNLLDFVSKEPAVNVSFVLLKPNNELKGKFWDIDSDGKVHSMVNTKRYALAFGNTGKEAIGTEGMFAPCASVKAVPVYNANKGWTLQCTAKFILGGAVAESDRFSFQIKPLTATDLGVTSS